MKLDQSAVVVEKQGGLVPAIETRTRYGLETRAMQ